MVQRVVTLTDRMNQTLAREKLMLRLAIGFGIVAMLLAAVGLYSSLAHSVARRTREIGVRLACGAEPGKVIAMVLREAAILTAVGLAIGLALAIGVGNALRAFLFGVPPGDPVTVVASCMVLTMVALVAAYVPARRASRIDPIARFARTDRAAPNSRSISNHFDMRIASRRSRLSSTGTNSVRRYPQRLRCRPAVTRPSGDRPSLSKQIDC
jgi:predicted lysophospholipase L1 biosynthesis ABC-type transport system permease subunit